jgi:hypothetical protein
LPNQTGGGGALGLTPIGNQDAPDQPYVPPFMRPVPLSPEREAQQKETARRWHAELERRMPGLYPPIKLPTTEEKEGIVIEDPSTGHTALLPGVKKAPMVDDLERTPIGDPQAQDEALLGPMYRGKPVSPLNPDYGSGKGRRGTPETRKEIDRIRDEFLKNNPSWEHVGGGTDQETGMKVPEEYLRGPQGTKGSSYVDLTFRSPTGELVRINTVDIDLNRPSQMSEREETNRNRIWWQDPETPIITIPKGSK